MGETNVTVPEPESTGKWIAKVIAAVILAEAAWSFIISATNNLILPALARVMVEDPQSPLYLGKGEFSVPAIFSSVLELCLAGIVAALLYQWSRSAPRVRVRTVAMKTVPVASKSAMPSILPEAPPPVVARPPAPVAPQPSPVAAPTAPAAPPPVPAAAPKPPAPPPKPAPAAKPSKPQKPAEVYYNIVGEPINPTEND
jgi:hypothetical protein